MIATSRDHARLVKRAYSRQGSLWSTMETSLPCEERAMKLLILLLAILTNAATSAAAQTAPIQGATIPLNEAEQHLIEHSAPAYPLIAKVADVEGAIRLTLEVNQRGEVVRVIGTSGSPLLLRAAADAAAHYRYRPFMINGEPADVLVEAVVTFQLHVTTPPVPFPEISDISSVLIEYTDGYIHLRVSGNGLVEYEGKNCGVVEGKHERQISKEEIVHLLEAFRKADFFSLNDDYSVAATDVGSETTSIQIGNQRKAITDNYFHAPSALKDVQSAIMHYSHSDQWTKGNDDTVPDLLAEAPTSDIQKEVLSDVLPSAALYSDISVVRTILSHPVDPNRLGPFRDTALMLAADRGLPDMVSALLKAGANPRTVDESGRNALIFGAGIGNAQVVQLLLAAGLKANAKDKYGDTALMAAAASGNPESVRELLKNGAQVNARNHRRQTALLSGATGDSGFGIMEMGRPHAEVPDESIHRDTVVSLLLAAGADINAHGWSGETALFSLEEDAVRELIRHRVDLEARDEYGQTALIETVSGSIAEILIQAGSDVNAKDKDGKTALIAAAENNLVDKLKVLVKASGIRLEERDNKAETALMKARAKNLQDSIRVLVSAGAAQ
jgi:ankyrin repeat protein